MSHLSIERLAALADEQPSADENFHLTRCAECARELDAIRSLVSLAGAERESMGLPLTRWETLSKRLRTEGLLAEGGGRREEGGHGLRFNSRPLLQIAAALLLVAGGVLAGRVSAGASMVPGGLTGNEPNRTAASDSVPTTFTSVAEAARWQSIYASGYQNAIAYLAALDSVGTPAMMRTRLSALDRTSQTMREALKDAPGDPVINDFYLNSSAQREATLRQLTTALPQGARLNSF